MDESFAAPSKGPQCQSGMTSIFANRLRKYIYISYAGDGVASTLEHET